MGDLYSDAVTVWCLAKEGGAWLPVIVLPVDVLRKQGVFGDSLQFYLGYSGQRSQCVPTSAPEESKDITPQR